MPAGTPSGLEAGHGRRGACPTEARQVEKTYSVREPGKTFGNNLEASVEEHPDVALFSKDSLDPVRLCDKLGACSPTPIVPGEALLFLDEVQSCPEALR